MCLLKEGVSCMCNGQVMYLRRSKLSSRVPVQ